MIDPGVTGGDARIELRLVTSGVLTFAELVRLERRMRRLGVVRRLRLEDFRNGVATHVAVLRSPLGARELADMLREAGVAAEPVPGGGVLELQATPETTPLRAGVA